MEVTRGWVCSGGPGAGRVVGLSQGVLPLCASSTGCTSPAFRSKGQAGRREAEPSYRLHDDSWLAIVMTLSLIIFLRKNKS